MPPVFLVSSAELTPLYDKLSLSASWLFILTKLLKGMRFGVRIDYDPDSLSDPTTFHQHLITQKLLIINCLKSVPQVASSDLFQTPPPLSLTFTAQALVLYPRRVANGG